MSKIIGFILLLLGVGLLVISSKYEPFTNKDEFNKKMYLLIDDENKSAKYNELRESYLTSKYKLENYGMVAIILGLYSLILIPKNWRNFKTLWSKKMIKNIGFLAVFLTIIGFVGDLFLESSRSTFPPWADSLAIPLFGVPFMFIILSGWFAFNFSIKQNTLRYNVSITEFRLKSTNYWYLSLLILTTFLVLFQSYYGDFWSTGAGIMWIYFYLSMLLGVQKQKE